MEAINIIKQYNGIILLYSYTQRMFVFEQIKGIIGLGQNDEKMKALPSILDYLSDLMHRFEQTKSLSELQIKELLDISEEVQGMLTDYLPSSPTSVTFSEKLSITGSTVYAEEHINSGVIKLGEIFSPEIRDHFSQRASFYRNRVNLVNQIVHKLANNQPIAPEERNQIEEWYEDLMENIDGIDLDFDTIRTFIKG